MTYCSLFLIVLIIILEKRKKNEITNENKPVLLSQDASKIATQAAENVVQRLLSEFNDDFHKNVSFYITYHRIAFSSL